MNAKELRLGNYIGIIHEGVETQATADHIKWISEGDKIYKPIPLTEDWLIRLGFEKEIDGPDNCFIMGMLAIDTDGFFVNLINEDEGFYLRIGIQTTRYVHQLQNVYYALTGNELTLKP